MFQSYCNGGDELLTESGTQKRLRMALVEGNFPKMAGKNANKRGCISRTLLVPLNFLEFLNLNSHRSHSYLYMSFPKERSSYSSKKSTS